MIKILISISKKGIAFSKSNQKINSVNLNNTNIINTDNIIFTDDYIKSNTELIATFLKLIVIKNKISDAIIDDYDIAIPILNLIHHIPEINTVHFSPKETLPHEVYEKLNEHRYLDNIECYNMAQYMFEDLNRKGYYVILKSKIFFISNFMYQDNLNTYSDLYYKKVLKIDFKLEEVDLKEFEAFLKINNNLKVIEITYFNRRSLEKILGVLASFRKKNIKILIYEKDKNIIKEIDYLRNLQKKYKEFKFKIIYSEKYKKENTVKQINLNILKTIILIVIITIICFFFINRKEEAETKNLKEKITEVKEEATGEKTKIAEAEEQKEKKPVETVYNKKYSKVFSELKKINNETIGWLTVNGTNIDYPVVKHSDNSYYLNHDYNKNTNRYGWVFADYQASIDPLGDNTIIYAHDSGSVMFSALYKTRNKKWYTNKENQIITFDTEKESGKWQIFSIYSLNNTNDYLTLEFGTDTSFNNYINMVKKRSIYNFNVNVTPKDNLLTLSTCYGDKQKLVIHAKKIS